LCHDTQNERGRQLRRPLSFVPTAAQVSVVGTKTADVAPD
jgi:hypothetical protein